MIRFRVPLTLPATMQRVRLTLAAAIVVSLQACSTDRSVAPSLSVEQAPPSETPADPGPDLLTTVAATPTLSVNGPLYPGKPIVVTIGLATNAATVGGSLEVVSLDDTSSAYNHQDILDVPASRAGTRSEVSQTLAFSSPGYYRLVAHTRSSPASDILESGSVVLSDGFAELYLLVDEQGGRIDREYDTTVATKHNGLAYGSFGPFGTSAVGAQGNGTRGPGSLLVTSSYSGVASYLDWQVSPAVYKPIRDGYVEAHCYTNAGTFSTSTRTDATGAFTVTFNIICNSADVRIQLIDSYSSVLGGGGLAVGAWMTLVLNGSVNYHIANDYAYFAYDDIRLFAPRAFTQFSRSRPRVSVWVSSSDPTYGVFYSSADDRIKTNFNNVLLSNGTFTTLHEYGHAFHYRALEPPRQSAGCTSHSIGQPISLNCAFVEGFADFFSWWVAGDSINGGGFNDEQVENNPFPTNGNGAIIEGAVAGLYYDLVDGTQEYNDPNNTNGVDDDSFTWPASYVATLIDGCSVKRVEPGTIPPVYTWYTTLSGIDEVATCFEHNANARQAVPAAYMASWRSYVDYSETASEPSGWTAATARSFWLYNLYNVGALP